MAPRKLIHKSRNVGGLKKPTLKRPPTIPQTSPVDSTSQTATTDNTSQTPPTDSTSPVSAITPNQNQRSVTIAQNYTGLSQVGNRLVFPKFDPNTYFATDLFKDTSALERTTKENADELVQSIEEKRQTVRVAVANIQLNQDVVKAGNEYLKLEGLAIDYATTGINNETKFVNYQVAGSNKNIALNKFDQTNERLVQGQATLTGMRSLTPLISDEWQARKSLKLSQISSLKIEATKAKEALEPKMTQLSQNFKQELEDLN